MEGFTTSVHCNATPLAANVINLNSSHALNKQDLQVPHEAERKGMPPPLYSRRSSSMHCNLLR